MKSTPLNLNAGMGPLSDADDDGKRLRLIERLRQVKQSALVADAGEAHNHGVDTALYIFSRVLTGMTAIGAVGCLLVIPFTAASILRVAFQKDSETEPAEPVSPPRIPVA